MRRVVMSLVILALVALPAAAGDHGKCKGSADDCLAKMSAKMADKGWLGVEGDKDDAGHFTVAKVVAGSPAEAAGFRPGDVLVAVNGVKYTKDNAEALHEVKAKLGPGSRATYTVKRGGAKVDLEATLTNVPREVMARWVGEHMLEHHAKVRMASK